MTHIPFLFSFAGYSVLTFLIALIFTKPFIRLLQHWKIGKTMREESVDGKSAAIFRALHLKKTGTPTTGGVLIWGTALAVILFSRFLALIGVIDQSLLQRGEVYLPLFTLVSMGVLGAIDDYLNVRGIGKKKGMEALPKIVITLVFAIVGALWFAFKLEYSSIHIPGLGDFDIGLWYVPLFIIITVATANAVNFTDGLDGLAGGREVDGRTVGAGCGVVGRAQGHRAETVLAGKEQQRGLGTGFAIVQKAALQQIGHILAHH